MKRLSCVCMKCPEDMQATAIWCLVSIGTLSKVASNHAGTLPARG